MSAVCSRLLSVLEAVLPRGGSRALHEPEFAGNEWVYTKECIDSGWVSSVGKFVDEFESRLVQFTGSRHAVAVVNGTAALQVAVRLAGVQSAEEVIVPALTFVATANAVVHCGAIPHFVDSEESSLGIDAEALRSHLAHIAERTAGCWRNRITGRRLAAIVPMHALGHPADMPRILDVASAYALPVIEDAAESLGSTLGGQHTGTFGLAGTLSFNGNKIVTTGGGGAILTNDAELARHAKHLTTTAKRPHAWEFFHDEVGFNYRLPNLNAALGCAQLERLPDMLARKRRLAERYRSGFAETTGLAFIDEPRGTQSNFWLNAVRAELANMVERDAILGALIAAGYQCRPLWTLMHRLPMYQHCPRAPLPIAEQLELSVIKLPSSATLIKH
ncbi:MAG: LegC family aminotransferase [Steroidobacteraceae bacterium]